MKDKIHMIISIDAEAFNKIQHLFRIKNKKKKNLFKKWAIYKEPTST